MSTFVPGILLLSVASSHKEEGKSPAMKPEKSEAVQPIYNSSPSPHLELKIGEDTSTATGSILKSPISKVDDYAVHTLLAEDDR